jgi:hypothetical protein
VASNSRELAQRPTVDPLDEPSVEWGWHGSFPNGTRIAAVVVAIGHHASMTEIIWMVVPALAVIFGVVWGSLRKRHAWRR